MARADAAEPGRRSEGANVMSGPETLPWRRRPPRDTRQFLSPAVRDAAEELGIDARGLLGRGTGGRVTLADVIAAGAVDRDERVPFNNIRKRTSVALLASKQTAAHASTVTLADYSRIESVRREARFTALAFVARAVIDALREYPALNATLDADDALTVH